MALGAAKRANSTRKALSGKGGGTSGGSKDGRRIRRVHSAAAQHGAAWGLPHAASVMAQQPAAGHAWQL